MRELVVVVVFVTFMVACCLAFPYAIDALKGYEEVYGMYAATLKLALEHLPYIVLAISIGYVIYRILTWTDSEVKSC